MIRSEIAAETMASARSDWLDAFRWSAAFLVLFAHTTNRFTLPLAEIASADRRPTDYLIGFLSGFSHQAVLVFFVLSGYLVGGSLFKEYAKTGRIDLTAYFVRRFARLWTVLLPTFLISFVLFAISVHMLNGADSGIFTPVGLASADLKTLACNIVFLQTLTCAQYASNGPLWSLFNEFWYYFLFAAVVWSWVTQTRFVFVLVLTLVATALAAASLLQRDGSAIGPYASIWLLGVVSARLREPLVRSTRLAAGLVVVFLLAVRLGIRRDWWDFHPIISFGIDLTLGALFANLLLTMRFSDRIFRLPFGAVHRKLAASSFSLYCIHVPILNLIYAYRSYEHMQKTMESFTVFATLTGSIAFSYAFYLIAERNTNKVRDALLALRSMRK